MKLRQGCGTHSFAVGKARDKQLQISGKLIGQDGAVADFAFLHFVDGLVGFFHGEELGGGFDAVAGGYVEHLAEAEGAADGAAADGALAGDEREGVDGDGRRRNAHEPEGSVGTQSLEVSAPVLIGVDGGEDEVEGAGYFFHGLGFAAIDEVMCAEGAGFLFFGQSRGEGSNLGTEGAGELYGEVTEAADADDADTRGGVDAVDAHGVVNGDAAAKQGRGLFAGQGIGDGNDKTGVGADAIGVAAVAMDAGAFRRGTEILLAAHTPLTLAAGVGLPAEADALADFKRADLAAERGNGADDLVTGDEGILADAPIVGDEVEVAVADGAMGDGDLNLAGAELARIVLERKKL